MTNMEIEGRLNAMTIEHELKAFKELFESGRWRTWLTSTQDVWALAIIVAQFFDISEPAPVHGAPGQNIDRYADVLADVRSVLDEWLGPAEGGAPYSEQDFIRAVFGDAWLSFVRPAYPENGSLADILEVSRPDIIPRLSPKDLAPAAETHSLQLPALDSLR